MGNSISRLHARPQRSKVDVHADLASSVHLDSLPIKLREDDLERTSRVGRRDLELDVELMLDLTDDDPALPSPVEARVVREDVEPLVVIGLVDLDVLDQAVVFFPKTLLPVGVQWACVGTKEWQPLSSSLHYDKMSRRSPSRTSRTAMLEYSSNLTGFRGIV
jgi:hypothetical protein